jgi:hypothetical protein
MRFKETASRLHRSLHRVGICALLIGGLALWVPPVQANQSYADAIAGVPAMSPFGLDESLAEILRAYYKTTYSDFRYWERLQSLRFSGTIELGSQELSFRGFKRKPDFFKIIVSRNDGSRFVSSFDGEDAWQMDTKSLNAEPVDMPEADALNFIRDAPIGGHLLYPTQEGKTITLLGKTDLGGREAYHLRIDLPDGQVIQSFLDTETFAEIRQILVNNVTGKEEITDFSDFRTVDGFRTAFKSQLTVDGQIVHRVNMHEMQTDAGVMTWMFERPEGKAKAAEAVEALPPPLATLAAENAPDPFARALNETITETSSFSVDGPSFGSDSWVPSEFSTPTGAENSATSFFTEPTTPALSR